MRKQSGVTLMELMIVMVVIGILTAIAYPNYRQYVIRTNRASGKTALLSTAQNLERCFTRALPAAYNSAACNAAVTLPITTPDGTYRIAHDAGSPTAVAYSLIATRQGAQAQDAKCGDFTLNQTGAQGMSGGSQTPVQCWSK